MQPVVIWNNWPLDHVEWMHVFCCLCAQTTFEFSQVWKVMSCKQANSIWNLHLMDGMVEGVVMAMLFSDLLDGIIAIASRHCAALPMGMDLLKIGIVTHRISACTLRYQDLFLRKIPKLGADNYFYMHIDGRFGFQKLCPGH